MATSSSGLVTLGCEMVRNCAPCAKITEGFPEMHTKEQNAESSGNMDMKLWSFLPEEALDKVIIRLPVHAFFRARLLSKHWKEKIMSLPFQIELCKVSSSWASFCPLYVGMDALLGFDRLSSRWRKLFTLSYLFKALHIEPDPKNLARCMTAVAGCLIGFKSHGAGPLTIYVTNPINQTFRQLAPLPAAQKRSVDVEHTVQLVALDPSLYKVVVVTTEVNYSLSGLNPLRMRSPLSVQIYDSYSKSWTEERNAPCFSSDWHYDSSTYFQGTVYSLFVNSRHGFLDESAMLNESIILLAFDTKKEVFRDVEFSLQQITNSYFWWSKLVVCGSDLMMVVAQMDPEIDLNPPNLHHISPSIRECNKYYESERLCIREQSLLVYRMDPSSLQMTEVSRGPSKKLHSMSLTPKVASDERCLYFQTLDELDSGIDSVIVFEVPTVTWSCLTQLSDKRVSRVQNNSFMLTNYAFQPGLNPFVVA